ncbi:MAG: TetR/AcrR family transcriptional regulator [Verrucomicrobiota bacterium]
MTKKSTSEKIITASLELLKQQGDRGVTMRKVAQLTGLSLSNVQYYFKTKDDLLKAMADRYFADCLDTLRLKKPLSSQEELLPALTDLCKEFLSHGHEISEMCRVFREYWAIATRNEAIEAYLEKYYCEMFSLLCEKLEPVSAGPESLSKAVVILIPYIEGYSITAKAMGRSLEQVSDTMAGLVASALKD